MTTPSPDPLSFQRATYDGDSGPDACKYCGRTITTEYFRVGGHLACPVCAQQALSLTPPDEHQVFMHALSYGAVAAVLGCIGYALVTILTGWSIGYAAIGVGYLIGWAMRQAAKQHGGRRYQWAAAILTYAAVSVAFIPIFWHSQSEQKTQKTVSTQQGGTALPASKDSPDNQHPVPEEPKPSFGKFLGAVGLLLGLGLVSPFLELASSIPQGLLNLFIIFIGVRFAWQRMAVRTVDVEGPFASMTPSG